jgi:hypothetical protein
MDGFPLIFDVISNRAVDTTGVKLIIIKDPSHEKTRYTVILACSADGTKLPLLLTFKQ